MAWELAYTSVACGPTGRSGFQFVGVSPGTPPEAARLVTPYMTYRPPPGAPAAPTNEQLAAFPTALTYGREGGHVVLARCRSTGRDYSGRYGNFLGRAVVATPEEMEGLRPIEFWSSPLWDRPPGAGHGQDEPGPYGVPAAVSARPPAAGSPRTDAGSNADAGRWAAPPAGDTVAPGPALTPGTAFDPETLVDMLARDREHDRLAAILDAVVAVLTGGHGRIVLVSADVERIARWIAVVSYSLPVELAARLSFTTYTDDPESAPQLLVGTVPAACPHGGFRLDEPAAPARPGRFARVLAGCWQRGDLDGIDAIGECVVSAAAPLDEAVAPDGGHPSPRGRTAGAPGTALEPDARAEPHAGPEPLAGPERHAGPKRHAGRGPHADAPGENPPRRRGASGGPRTRPPAPAEPHVGDDGPAGAASAAGGGPVPGGAGLAARLDAAAALLALCRQDGPVSAAEQAAVAALVRKRGAPAWVWPAISGALPGLGFDLAAALAGTAAPIDEHCVRLALADPEAAWSLPPLRLRDGMPGPFRAAVAAAPGLPALAAVLTLAERVGGAVEPQDVTAAAAACARRGAGALAEAVRVTPEPWRDALVAGVLAGLEAADPPMRRAMLTPEACAALGDRDWRHAPRTGGIVLAAGPDRRAATAGLVGLEPYGVPDAGELLATLWDTPPSASDCRWLVERLPEAVLRFGPLRAVPRDVFDVLPVDEEETVRLAELVRDRLPILAGPARLVLACDAARHAGTAEEIARALEPLATEGALAARARAAAARALRGRSPACRARVLGAVPAAVRDDLAGHWVTGPGRRAEVDLAEIEARLAATGAAAPPLRAWADGLGRFARRRVESALTDRDPGLAAAWRSRRREA